MQPAVCPSPDDAQPSGWVVLVQTIVGLLIGGMLFLGLWALFNAGFGTALDGPIAAFLMEKPCQRLAGTAERLTGYTLGRDSKGRRSTPAVCHFGLRSVTVAGPIDALGFRWREFPCIVIGLGGYAVCFVSAGVGTVPLVLQGWRLLGRLGRWCRPSPVTPAPAPRRRRRR